MKSEIAVFAALICICHAVVLELPSQDRKLMELVYNPLPGASLLTTMEKFLTQTMSMDGVEGSVQALNKTTDSITVIITSDDKRVSGYNESLLKYWEITTKGAQLAASGKVSGIIPSEWQFFPPHGWGLLERELLFVLHYPPIKVWEAQDYFNCYTIERMHDLFHNQSLNFPESAMMVDIIPMAFDPYGHYTMTDDIYQLFRPYSEEMILYFTKNGTIPISACGGPASKFLLQTATDEPCPDTRSLLYYPIHLDYVLATGKHVDLRTSFGWHPSYIVFSGDREEYIKVDDERTVGLVKDMLAGMNMHPGGVEKDLLEELCLQRMESFPTPTPDANIPFAFS